MTKNYAVAGLTSQEDADKLIAEIDDIPGTHGTDVDLAAGRIYVSGVGFTDDQVVDAVVAAGFSLVADDSSNEPSA